MLRQTFEWGTETALVARAERVLDNIDWHVIRTRRPKRRWVWRRLLVVYFYMDCRAGRNMKRKMPRNHRYANLSDMHVYWLLLFSAFISFLSTIQHGWADHNWYIKLLTDCNWFDARNYKQFGQEINGNWNMDFSCTTRCFRQLFNYCTVQVHAYILSLFPKSSYLVNDLNLLGIKPSIFNRRPHYLW